MRLDKQNAIETLPDASVDQRFFRPSASTLLKMVLVMTAFSMVMFFFIQPKFDLKDFAILVLGFTAMVISIVFFFRQRVDIRGTTVRYSNVSIFHRSRTFDVADVIGLALRPQFSGDSTVALVATLKASPARKWERVDMTSMENFFNTYDENIDSPLLLAFFAAVQTAHPGLKIGNLPPSYHGALPRA